MQIQLTNAHPLCATKCQKLDRINQVCLGSCELAPFAGVVANKPTGTNCSICGEPQVMSPSGVTCKFGHGGAAAKEDARLKVIENAFVYGLKEPPPVQPVVINEPPKRINVRSKGQRGEREVVKLLQEVVDNVRAKYKAEPLVLQRNTLQAHLGGCDLHGLEGFAVEVKFCETEVISQWWKQTISQATKLSVPGHTPHVPILFYRASRSPWLVKFRAFVQTPRERDLIEMDVTSNLEDFLTWFADAYDEKMVEWAQTLN